VRRRRLVLAYAVLALGGGLVVGAGLLSLLGSGTDAVPCSHVAPRGAGLETIRATTALWVTDVLMRQEPGCGYELATRRLRARLSRADWAAGKSPVPVFATRFPVVAYADARKDSARTQAVYAISRRLHEVLQPGRDGTFEAHMAAGLAAPDTGLAGYDLVLRLEDGGWRIDRCWRVTV
jgi:hypothetical protein